MRTKSGMFGFGMLGLVLAVVIAVPIIAPYDLVRTWGDPSAWSDLPRNAAPDWIDAFSDRKFARNIIIDWNQFRTAESSTNQSFKIIITRARWTFGYDTLPSDLRILLRSDWTDKKPLITIEWKRPDGESLVLFNAAPELKAPHVDVLSLPAMEDVQQRVQDWAKDLGAEDVAVVRPQATLYAVQGPEMLDSNRARVLKGEYTLTIEAIAFDLNDTVEARFISYGSVYGLAGTDHLKRDLLVGLLWGAPVALAFGAAAAVLTVMAQVILGAMGAFYGRRFDELIQRFTDFLIIIPVLPILILFAALYRIDLITILVIVVVFNIVGGTTKVVRSITLQTKEELFVESARSYGASRSRILFRHILPRTMPYTFALLALSVPSFIFLEASLSFLGLGDPIVPTWGTLMGDASRNGALYNGLWWWIAFPALGIVFITVAFSFLGYAFDKVLNPRLREE